MPINKVTIFTMNKYVTPHMIEKLDRSAYVYENSGEKEDDPDETEDEEDSDDDSDDDESSEE